MVSAFPSARVRATFRAAAVAFVPELGDASDPAWDRLEATVANALADRPPRVARQLTALLRALDLLARLRFGRRLDRLDAARRTGFLRGFERFPLLVLRRGIWGLRTLVFLGYYTQSEVAARIGYRAHPAGWEARR
jgi:hypothetical protein